MSTRSTGVRTNKRYAILLEFLGDLCLKVGFCLSVIPFSSAINAGADPGFFLGGGALVSCSSSTPIHHIVFFCGIPVE